MALVKFGHASIISTQGQRIVKESYDRCIVLIKADQDNYYCLEVPDNSYAEWDADQLHEVPGCRKHPVYKDSDGTLWVNLPQAIRPEVDKSCRAVKYGPGAEVPDCPPPLVPFAGCDRKPMAPSPAKPFAIPASPLKPSPFKERVDTATEAVVRKNWNARQAKMGEFFGPKKKVVTGAWQEQEAQENAAV